MRRAVSGSSVCRTEWQQWVQHVRGVERSHPRSGQPDGFWWNGTAFVGSAINAPTTGAASWHTALPATALTNGVSDTVTASATDTARNVGVASSRFTYDTQRPIAVSATVTNQNGTVQGTGRDARLMGTRRSPSR